MKVKEVSKAQFARSRARGHMTRPNTCKQAALMVAAFLCGAPPISGFADLTPEAQKAFERYVAAAETRIGTAPRIRAPEGQKIVTAQTALEGGKEIKVPGGLVQDLLGSIFLPHLTIPQVRAVMQAYPDYKRVFAPEVIESKILKHDGDRYQVFLRLYKKQIVTVVLNSTYDVRYSAADPRHLAVDSRSTRIAEVRRPKDSYDDEYPVGRDTGFLWKLNSYWRFAEADGGVYAECEAISLSRDVPFGLGFIRKFVERFPRESMDSTLESLRRAMMDPARVP